MKRLLMVFVFVIMLCSQAWGAYEKSGIIYYPTDGTSAAALLVGIEAKGTPCTMKFIHASGVSTPYIFSSDDIFPKYVTLDVEQGAYIHTSSGVTVIVNGEINAGNYSITSGDGKLLIRNGSEINVAWYTNGGSGTYADPFIGKDGMGGIGEALDQVCIYDGPDTVHFTYNVFKLNPSYYEITDTIRLRQHNTSLYCDGGGKRMAFLLWAPSGDSDVCIDIARDDPITDGVSYQQDISLKGIFVQTSDTTYTDLKGIRVRDGRDIAIENCGVRFLYAASNDNVGFQFDGRDDLHVLNCLSFADRPIVFGDNVSNTVAYNQDMSSFRDLYLIAQSNDHYCIEFEGATNTAEFSSLTFDGFNTFNDGIGAIQLINGELRSVSFSGIRYEDHQSNDPWGYFFDIVDTDSTRDISFDNCWAGGTIGPNFIKLRDDGSNGNVINAAISNCSFYSSATTAVFLDLEEQTYPVVLSNVFAYSGVSINLTGDIGKIYSVPQRSPAGVGTSGAAFAVYGSNIYARPDYYSGVTYASMPDYIVSEGVTTRSGSVTLADSGADINNPASGSTYAITYYGDTTVNRAIVITVWSTRHTTSGKDVYGKWYARGLHPNIDINVVDSSRSYSSGTTVTLLNGLSVANADVNPTNLDGMLCYVSNYGGGTASEIVIQNNLGETITVAITEEYL